MSFCNKCGAYIPIGETACPACGYDPEAEARKAKEEAERAAAEESRRAKEAAAEKARLEAEQREREEQERRRYDQQQRWQQDPRQYTHSGGAAQGQYASQRTGGASQPQYASQRTGYTGSSGSSSPYSDDAMRRQASESVSRQKLSVLSYLGILWLIPFISQRNDPFTKFHTNQGLVLLIASVICNALGSIIGLFSAIGSLGYIVGAILGIRNVLRGKMEPLPFIGNIHLLK